MKTWIPTPAEINRAWVVVDASDLILGRLASNIAIRLRGKHKPEYTPFLDNGDFVVVVNASKLKVTGNKLLDKKYRKHTGFFGGLKETSLRDLLAKKPEKVLELAVRGMLPKNRLSRHLLTKLKVYPGPEHPHAAQNPVAIDIK